MERTSAKLMDCMTRVRTMAAVGGAAAVLTGMDTAFPYSRMTHHALAGVAAEAAFGQGLRILPLKLVPDVDQLLDVGCAAFTGVAAGWFAGRARNTIGM